MELNFEPISLDRQNDYRALVARVPQLASDYSFLNLWAWAEEYGPVETEADGGRLGHHGGLDVNVGGVLAIGGDDHLVDELDDLSGAFVHAVGEDLLLLSSKLTSMMSMSGAASSAGACSAPRSLSKKWRMNS